MSNAVNVASLGTAMTADASGNVGIGTSSPSGRVHAVSAPGTVQVRWSDATNGTANLDTASGLSRVWSNVALAFGTGAESFTERARIDSSGRFLVGGNNPYGTVALNANATNIGTINPTALFINITSSTYRLAQFEVNFGGAIGTITTNGSTTAYNTMSDYRLKEDIQPMVGALARIAALKPCTYTWKKTGAVSEGFIAHELQAVVPDCVNGEKDAVDAEGNPQYQGIDTSFLVATLTAAIQEQQALITQLQADVAALKGAA